MNTVKPLIYLLGAVVAVSAIQAGAQSPRPTPQETPQETVEAPAHGPRVLTELEKLRARLGELVKQAEGLAANMKSTAAKTPEQTRGEVRNASKTLSDLADRCGRRVTWQSSSRRCGKRQTATASAPPACQARC